jgi:hypothetical protein
VAGDSVKAVRSRSAPAWVRVSISSLYRLHKSRKTNNLPGPSTANREYRSSFFWRFFGPMWGRSTCGHPQQTTTRTTTATPVWHERESNFLLVLARYHLSESSPLNRIQETKTHTTSPASEKTKPHTYRPLTHRAQSSTRHEPSTTRIADTDFAELPAHTPTQPESPACPLCCAVEALNWVGR